MRNDIKQGKTQIEAMIKLLQQLSNVKKEQNAKYTTSMRYYRNENDITLRNNGVSKLDKRGKDDPLRSADNRVSSNFHQLLVDQEAGYLATERPKIDVEDEGYNQRIDDVLGDNFPLRLNQLVVDAANSGEAWLHYWIDEDNNFRYGIIDPSQVTPLYSTNLISKLVGLKRSYEMLDSKTGKNFTVHEYWTDKEVSVYKSAKPNYADLAPYNLYSQNDVSTDVELDKTNVYEHGFGRIPFISFPKNKLKQPDLYKYKGLIDVYDDVFNGFVNDVDDVQQVILVLTNYGGTNLTEFIDNLKKDKAVKFENSGAGDKSGLDKLTIDIPVEARKSLMEITKSDIFVHGQGVDPTKFVVNNASGTAIKMLYSHLELKASTTEAYFKDSLNELIRAIMRHLKMEKADERKIMQIWKRSAIQNDLEKAQAVSYLADITSDEAIAKANPLVEDWQMELKKRTNDIVRGDGYGKTIDEHEE